MEESTRQFVRIRQAVSRRTGPIHELTDDGKYLLCKFKTPISGEILPQAGAEDATCDRCQKRRTRLDAARSPVDKPAPRPRRKADKDPVYIPNPDAYMYIQKSMEHADMSAYDLFCWLKHHKKMIRPGTKIRILGHITPQSTLGILVSEDGSIALMAVD